MYYALRLYDSLAGSLSLKQQAKMTFLSIFFHSSLFFILTVMLQFLNKKDAV